MTEKQIRKVIGEIIKSQKAIAKERDKLDELISEWDQLKFDCEGAWRSLQEAREYLSQLL
jgi:dsDNA-specific endonuclease/ATPase MutS2